jgi:hypothetical protein
MRHDGVREDLQVQLSAWKVALEWMRLQARKHLPALAAASMA